MIKTKGMFQIINNRTEKPIPVTATPEENGSMFSVSIDDNLFTMNSIDSDKVLNYFKYVNNEILEVLNENVDTIKREISNVSLELIEMIANFLYMVPLNILLYRDDYIAFEHLISYSSFTSQQILDSTSEERNKIIDKLKKEMDFYKNLDGFIDTTYTKFIKVAGKYINIPEKYHSIVLWKLLRNASVEFLSERWNKEYGVHLKENTEIIALDDYVDIYCRCSDIPTKNVASLGLFTYYLIGKNVFPKEINGNFLLCNTSLLKKVIEKTEEIELATFEKRLTMAQAMQSITYSINDIDLMDGHEFERFVSFIFTKMGYITEITRGSGDQGLDVIAEKNGVKIGIQAKCYSSKVSNTAVQEISAALRYYNCCKGMVITNNYFTNSAMELAESNDIVLWNRDILKMKIEEIYFESL